MKEPSFRDVAVLPVLAVAAGAVFVLSTVVGQGASAGEDCGPGSHSMSMSKMPDMPGMDHGSMAMGSGGCMEGTMDSMSTGGTPGSDAPPTDSAPMPGMDKDTKAPAKKAAKKHGSMKGMKGMDHSMHMN